MNGKVETCPRCGCVFGSHWTAFIAKLEADKEAMRGTITHQTNIINHATTSEQHLRERAEQAEAAIEHLKVCGNCLHFAVEEFQYCNHPETLDSGYDGDMPYYISAPDKCDFTPSRWAERGGE